MLTKQILAVVGLAAAQSVAALETFRTSQFNGRVSSSLIGTICYPQREWTFPSSEPIAPCVSEQIISSECEKITISRRTDEVAMNAYRSCLLNGSSYKTDLKECLQCKVTHNIHFGSEDAWWRAKWDEGFRKFENAPTPAKGLWEYVVEGIRWEEYPSKPNDFKKNTNTTYTTNYYTKATKQNIGTFTFEGVTHPVVSPRKLRARAEPATDGKSRQVIRVEFNTDHGIISSVDAEVLESLA